MRWVIWLVILFVVASLAAGTLGNNDGIVSIYWSPWRVDLSLNLFLLGIVVTGALSYVAVGTLNRLIGLPERARGQGSPGPGAADHHLAAGRVELKHRRSGEVELVTIDDTMRAMIHDGAAALQVAHHITHPVARNQHVYLVHRLENLGGSLLEGLTEGITACQAEGNFIGVNRVHLAFIHVYADVAGIRTGKRSLFNLFHDPFQDSWHETCIN